MLILPDKPSLPLIDISPFLDANASEKDKQRVAKELDHACREIGFFYLIGHGLSESQVKDIINISKEFFQLPDEEKEEISIRKGDNARGYQKLGENVTKGARDWHEALDYYAPVDENHTLKKRSAPILTGTNPWPKRPAGFESVVKEYVDVMHKIGAATMRAMALALGYEEPFFERYLKEPFWVLRIIGYPPLKKDMDGVGVSCGEHTDYGCLTILNTDETRGALQVLNRAGEWVTADPIPGAFVINIGDMFNVWTNGMYKSTLHRVIHTNANYRVSTPFFYEPSFDAMIEPLAECVAKTGGVEKHQPVMYGDHLYSKVSGNFY